ncbi:MAG: hypothetical protein WC551_11930 [Patescibacteria group bacterium]
MQCGDCKWFDYYKDPFNGRRRRIEKGVCNYPIPPLPRYVIGQNWKPELRPNRVFDTVARMPLCLRDCPTFAAKEKKGRKAQTVDMPDFLPEGKEK